MKKALVLAYGFLSYTLFLGVFLYMIGFMGDFLVPRSLDTGPETPFGTALFVNLGLILIFSLQHSVMARPGFKSVWTRVVPKSVERSTYVLFSSLALALLMWQWRPIGGYLWNLNGTMFENVAWAGFAFGWLFLLASTFLVNHFDLFGLRQVVHAARGTEPKQLAFAERYFYKFVRHPIYVGWLMLTWITPVMTVGHLVYALGMTAYILTAIPFEERDLIAIHGEKYKRYQDRVPALLARVTPAPADKGVGSAA